MKKPPASGATPAGGQRQSFTEFTECAPSIAGRRGDSSPRY